jgi:nucleoside-diphosphate-sugar epimerase
MVDAIVSGGAGFIGSHLCAALLDRGHSVLCIDNLATGSAENVERLQDCDGYTFLRHDVTRPLPHGVETRDARLVFHLASPASVPGYLSRPIETLDVNSLGTRVMLDIARASNATFLFASTSEIYGDPLEHPQRETYWGNVSSVGIRACYDESKRFGEALTTSYVRSYGVDARVVRIFNTYGPHSRIDDGRMAPNFIVQALRGEPLTIYGDGRQTRSLCYVSDLVAGILAAVDTPHQAGEVFNLGNPREQTIVEFAAAVCAALGRDLEVAYLPLPEDDPTRRQPDITKAANVLGWEPTVALEDGVRTTVEWFRRRLERIEEGVLQ